MIFTNDRDDLNGFGIFLVWVVSIGLGLALVCGLFYAYPKYRVWSKELAGQAQLKEAEWNRQIIIKEAEANLEAEKMNALAEIERARGMAASMEIENGTLNETYIRYLWVRGMVGNENVIYIPTEGSIPILEVKPR